MSTKIEKETTSILTQLFRVDYRIKTDLEPEDISPEITIRFGTESLVLDTWAVHHQYTALCSVMGPGMTSHLQENDFIRDIFQLGSKIAALNPVPKHIKSTKLERHLLNAAAFKARTITRGKNRDKRSAVFS